MTKPPTSRGVSPLARRMREARAHKNISQRQLGLLIELEPSVASSRINHYEQGRHAPPYQIVAKIAEVTGLPDAFFFCHDDWLAQLIRSYANLKTPERRKLQAFLKQFG